MKKQGVPEAWNAGGFVAYGARAASGCFRINRHFLDQRAGSLFPVCSGCAELECPAGDGGRE